MLRCAAAALGALLVLIGLWRWPSAHDRYGLPFWLWLVGLATWGAAFAGLSAGRPPAQRVRGSRRALFAVLALAALLRFPAIDRYPYGIHRDEGFGLVAARQIADGELGNVISQIPRRWVYSSSMQLLPRVPFVAWLGHKVAAVRVLSAILGVASIGLAYLLVRRLLGARGGIYAALLLTVSYTHIHYSRVGTEYTQPPFFAALVLWLMVRALQRRSLFDAAAAGAALGVGLGAYAPIKIVPLTLVVWWLSAGIVDYRFLLRHGARLLLCLATAAAVAAPVYTDAGNRELLRRKPAGMSIFNDETLARMESRYQLRPEEGAALTVRRLRVFGETLRRAWPCVWKVNGQISTDEPVSAPLVHPVVLGLIGLGAVLTLGQWRSPYFWWAVPLLALTFFIGVGLTDRSGGMWRLSVADPAVALLFALSLTYLERWIVWPLAGWRWGGVVPTALAGALLFYLAWWNVGVLTRHYATARAGDALDVIGRAVTEGPAGMCYVVQISPKLYRDIAVLNYTFADRTIINMTNLVDLVPDKLPQDKPICFLFADSCETWIEPWRDLFPFARLEGLANGVGVARAWRAVVAPAELAQARRIGGVAQDQGLRGVYYGAPEWEGEPVMERVDPLLEFTVGAPASRAATESIRWSGLLLPPLAGRYELRLSVRFPETIELQIVLGDETEISWRQRDVSVVVGDDLAPIPLVVRYSPLVLRPDGATFYVEWRPPDAADFHKIPRRYLRPTTSVPALVGGGGAE